MSRHPIVKWAQKSDKVFITVELPDAKNVKHKLDPEGKFSFSATAGADNTPYEVEFDLFDKVDVNESKTSTTCRSICYLVKKAESKWWTRFLKEGGKLPVFLKVDWDKWVDDDEEDEKTEPGSDMDFGDFDLSKLNMGGGGDFDADADADADAADKDERDDGSDTEDEIEEEEAAASGELHTASASKDTETKA